MGGDLCRARRALFCSVGDSKGSSMDRIQAMEVFTRVVDANSFTRAADTLAMPRASVTTIIRISRRCSACA